jgi:hypothetical protein
MSNIPESYLSPNSQPWGRWVTNSLREFFRKREEYDIAVQNSIRQINIAIPQPMRGAISRQTSGTVTITTAGVYEPINLAGTLDTDVSFNMSISGAPNVSGLKNDTDQTRTMVVIGSYDGKAGNNQTIGCKLAINGVLIDESECTSFSGNILQFSKTLSQWIVKLGPGDEVTMYAANLDATDDIDLTRYKMVAHAIP